MINSNTPSIRLEQDNRRGWGAYTWDLGANETNFFVQDASEVGVSCLPFSIRAGAPDRTLALASEGRVGIGTWYPQYPVDLLTDGKDALLVARREDGARAFVEGSATQAQFGSLSAHPVALTAGYDDATEQAAAALALDVSGTLTVTVDITPTLKLDPNGNLTLSGVLTEASDVHRKEHFQSVDDEAVLAALAELPISTWNYIGDDPAVRHMGPMSQDFYAAFGLGADDTHLAPLDVNGVTLAALQAQTRRVEALEAENADLSERLAQLEALVAELVAQEE